MNTLFTSQLTYVSVIILLCLIASGFYFLSPLKKVKHNIRSERYLSLFYLISAASFTAFIFSLYQTNAFSTFMNDFLYILAVVYLKSAFISRHSDKSANILLDKISLSLLVLTIGVNQYLFHFIDSSQLARVFILNISIILITLSIIKHVPLDKNRPSFGEKLATLALKLSILLISMLFVTLSFTSDPFNFLSALTVVVAVNTLLLFGSTLTMFLSEISDMYHKESSVDFLTGLLNRRQFYDSSETIINLAKRQNFEISLMMCDLDNFKFINDTFGHDVGDQVIKDCASIIKDATRDTDITARFGGEEFCLVLPYTDIKGAGELAERIRSRISESLLKTHICDVRYTASFGLSTLNLEQPLNTAIIESDVALYYAKDAGRNRVIQYSTDMKLDN